MASSLRRKGPRDPLIIVLEKRELCKGATHWLRVTGSRDERNRRECYCVNFYSVSPSDSPAVSETISGSKRINLRITDSEFKRSDVGLEAFIRSRIIEAVQQHSGAFHLYLSLFHGLILPSLRPRRMERYRLLDAFGRGVVR